ncbi:hypothetical protein JCM1841_003547 [Sporobolomyces salmonicolor]
MQLKTLFVALLVLPTALALPADDDKSHDHGKPKPHHGLPPHEPGKPYGQRNKNVELDKRRHTVDPWAQCGGKGWKGGSHCPHKYHCCKVDGSHSYCVPHGYKPGTHVFSTRDVGHEVGGGYTKDKRQYGDDGRDGYGDGRDGYGGERGGYGGDGRDGYGDGRDGYGDGRDGYGDGRDGYGDGRGHHRGDGEHSERPYEKAKREEDYHRKGDDGHHHHHHHNDGHQGYLKE